jgi:hypothetical protein
LVGGDFSNCNNSLFGARGRCFRFFCGVGDSVGVGNNKRLLLVLTLPINVLTLGLFTLVINAALIMLTSALVQGFYVPGFWWALLFSVVLMLVNTGLHLLERGRNF